MQDTTVREACRQGAKRIFIYMVTILILVLVVVQQSPYLHADPPVHYWLFTISGIFIGWFSSRVYHELGKLSGD